VTADRDPSERFNRAWLTLEGKQVVLTGASRNIGASLARGLALAGADLLLVARGAARLDEVAAAVRSETGRRVETLAVDISEPGAAAAVAAAAVQQLGGVDVLVNNAYSPGGEQGPMLGLPDPVWDEVLATNLLGPVRLCRECVPSMLDRGGGSVINLVSGSGFLPSPGLGAYGVSKAALWMATRYLAAELAPDIRVNALCPGIVTPDATPTHEIFRQLLPLVPMKRLGRPDEIVGAAVYLACDAASYTTGEVLIVNGGRPW
jgi:NAD(P)-dependent dehydrogenase (short-subunit alcohol dehydrogenase family)